MKETFKSLICEIVGGFTLSGLGALIVPEIIHLVFIVVGGFAGTVVIHLTRRWIKKHFPS